MRPTLKNNATARPHSHPATPCQGCRVMVSDDTLSIYSLALAPNIGPDAWDRDREQPVLLTLHLHLSLVPAAASDDLAHSIHYGYLSKQLLHLQSRLFPTLLHLADAAIDLALDAVHDVHVVVEAPKLLLQARSLAVDVVASPAARRRTVHVNELDLYTLIGVNPPERRHKQRVLTTVSFLDSPLNFPHRAIVDRLAQVGIYPRSLLNIHSFTAH